jgi:hypothetical protein
MSLPSAMPVARAPTNHAANPAASQVIVLCDAARRVRNGRMRIVGRFDADVPLAAATVSPREPQAEQFLHSVEHPEVIRPANHSKTETGVR